MNMCPTFPGTIRVPSSASQHNFKCCRPANISILAGRNWLRGSFGLRWNAIKGIPPRGICRSQLALARRRMKRPAEPQRALFLKFLIAAGHEPFEIGLRQHHAATDTNSLQSSLANPRSNCVPRNSAKELSRGFHRKQSHMQPRPPFRTQNIPWNHQGGSKLFRVINDLNRPLWKGARKVGHSASLS